MSHFTLIVTGYDVKEQLAPYDQNKDVDPYPDYVTSEEIDAAYSYASEKGWPTESVGETLGALGRYIGKKVECDEKGFFYWSTYNPLSKWDWWVVGGRWRGFFRLKRGVAWDLNGLGEPGTFERVALRHGEPAKNYKGKADVARKVDIDFAAMRADAAGDAAWIPFALLHKGTWHESGDMGWFGASTDKMTTEQWQAKVRSIIESLPDHTLLSLIDCHI